MKEVRAQQAAPPCDTAQTGAVCTTARGEDKRTSDTPCTSPTHSAWAPSGPASQPRCLHRLQQGTLAPRRADLQGEVLYAATGFCVSVSPSARGRGRKHDNTCLFVILTRTLVGKAKGACRCLGPSGPVYLPLPQSTYQAWHLQALLVSTMQMAGLGQLT